MKTLDGKLVMVVGATGFIGHHLVDVLLDNKSSVIAYGRSYEKLRESFSDKVCDNSLWLCAGDLTESFPKGFRDIDYIFYAAGSISGKTIREKPVDIIDANLVGLKRCLEYLRQQGKGRLIILSSATVYGEVIKDIVVSENDTSGCEELHNATIAYSESKRMAEVMATSYSKQYGVDVVIARLSYVYGYAEPMPNTAFFSFIKSAIADSDIEIHNMGLPCRDNIFVEDAVRGLICIATEGKKQEAYNVSSNGEKNNYKAMDEIADIISDVAKKNGIGSIAVIKCENNQAKTRSPGMKMNNNKLKSLGWEVTTDIYEGIEDTLISYARLGSHS